MFLELLKRLYFQKNTKLSIIGRNNQESLTQFKGAYNGEKWYIQFHVEPFLGKWRKCSGCLPHNLLKKWVLTDFTGRCLRVNFVQIFIAQCTPSLVITTQFRSTFIFKKWTILQFGRHTNEAFMTLIEHCTLDSIRYFPTKYDKIVVTQHVGKVKTVKKMNLYGVGQKTGPLFKSLQLLYVMT